MHSKTTEIHGQPAVESCGPGTAVLYVGGKTYTFRNGFCEQSASAGTTDLQLGTLAPTVKGNAGLPLFDIGGTRGVSAVVTADYGRKEVASGPVAITGKLTAKGTFKSKFSGPGFGPKFSGTWNCHGVLYKAP